MQDTQVTTFKKKITTSRILRDLQDNGFNQGQIFMERNGLLIKKGEEHKAKAKGKNFLATTACE